MAEKHALIPGLTMYPQTETKDLSKNLMSNDFEKQYCEKVKSKKWKQGCAIAAVLSIVALLVWLLVVVIIRDVQINKLREEVDELTATVIAVSANVKSLNQKYNNKLSNEFRSDETIYADEDQDITSLVEGKKHHPQYESLDKLHGLTVLEDDEDAEEPLDVDLDDDDAESGDWYPDYDNREKIGSTNMVHLRPEDFADSVVTIERSGDRQALLNNIREIKRLLNANPENPNLPDLLDPTAAAHKTEPREKRSLITEPAAVDQFAAPRVVSKAEERRKTKKYSGNLEAPTEKTQHTVTRTVRDSHDEQRRPFIAAHFHGNTSHLSPEIHEHYKGNGLVRVAHGAPHDVWYPAPWTSASPHPRPTLTRNGHVHVHHTGVYLVYVQIYYLDSHDVISWVLHRTNSEIDGRETLLQCAQSAHSAERLDKPNSCFSASALFLKAGDKLAVRNTGGDRHSLMQPEKSFIGLVKLADAEDPEQEF